MEEILWMLWYDFLEKCDWWLWCDVYMIDVAGRQWVCGWSPTGRIGGDVYILRVRLRLRLDGYLGREGGWCVLRLDMCGVDSPLHCVLRWTPHCCAFASCVYLFGLFYHITRNVIGRVREAFQWVHMVMPCEMWSFMLNVIYVVWCSEMDFDFWYWKDFMIFGGSIRWFVIEGSLMVLLWKDLFMILTSFMILLFEEFSWFWDLFMSLKVL